MEGAARRETAPTMAARSTVKRGSAGAGLACAQGRRGGGEGTMARGL
jgi:hypothetical protein